MHLSAKWAPTLAVCRQQVCCRTQVKSGQFWQAVVRLAEDILTFTLSEVKRKREA